MHLSSVLGFIACTFPLFLALLHATFLCSWRYCLHLSSVLGFITCTFPLFLALLLAPFICSWRYCLHLSSVLGVIACTFPLFLALLLAPLLCSRFNYMQFMKCYAQKTDRHTQQQGLGYNKFSHQLQAQVCTTFYLIHLTPTLYSHVLVSSKDETMFSVLFF